MRKKHCSIRTEQAYVNWIRVYILSHRKRYPKDIGKNAEKQWVAGAGYAGPCRSCQIPRLRTQTKPEALPYLLKSQGFDFKTSIRWPLRIAMQEVFDWKDLAKGKYYDARAECWAWTCFRAFRGCGNFCDNGVWRGLVTDRMRWYIMEQESRHESQCL